MRLKMSESEIRRAVCLYETGVSPEAIGGELGYSPRTVRRYLSDAGVYSTFDHARIPAGLAAMMREPVRTHRPRARCEHALRRHLPAITAAYDKGYGVQRIAKAIGVDRDYLKMILLRPEISEADMRLRAEIAMFTLQRGGVKRRKRRVKRDLQAA